MVVIEQEKTHARVVVSSSTIVFRKQEEGNMGRDRLVIVLAVVVMGVGFMTGQYRRTPVCLVLHARCGPATPQT